MNSPVDKYDAPSLMAKPGGSQFHVMIKPVGAACNLACTYCFYLGKASLAGAPAPRRMSDEVLTAFIRQYIGSVSGDVIFSWQGGEPTTLGLDFFRQIVAIEAQFARPGQTILNDLQTNGTLLDEEWCRFLKQHQFLVGLSIDGPREIHDRCRLTKGGEPTFAKVLAAARLLKSHGVAFNAMACITGTMPDGRWTSTASCGASSGPIDSSSSRSSSTRTLSGRRRRRGTRRRCPATASRARGPVSRTPS